MRWLAWIILLCPLLHAAPVSFRNDLAPLFLARCQGCHGSDKTKGSYRLDTFEKLMQPGESGDAPVVPGKADKSALYRLVTTAEEADRMPKKGEPLSPTQTSLIKRWIDEGARLDAPSPTASLASLSADREQPAPPDVYQQPVPLTAMAFSPDGALLAASGYHEVTLWDPATGKLLGRIPHITERIYALEFSADGHRLALAGGEPGTLGEVRLCDVEHHKAGKPLDRISDVMLAVRFSPDGALLAAGGADNQIRLFDVANGKRLRTIEQHADWVTDLAFSPDGAKLAAASRDKSARIFEVKDGAVLTAFLGHEEIVYAVAWTADGASLWSAGHDRKLQIWSALDAKPIGQIAGFLGDPLKLQIAGSRVFVCVSDGGVREYSADKREWVRDYGKGGDWSYSMALDLKHNRLAIGGYSGEVTVWDTQSGAKLTHWIAAPGLPLAPH